MGTSNMLTYEWDKAGVTLLELSAREVTIKERQEYEKANR